MTQSLLRAAALLACSATFAACGRIDCGEGDLEYDPDRGHCACPNRGEYDPDAGVCRVGPELPDSGGEPDSCVARTFFRDTDGDGHGTSNDAVSACIAPEGFVSSDDDCDDDCATCTPGRGIETCDGRDEDCDGSFDEGFDRRAFHRDEDGDGFGGGSESVTACAAPAGHVEDDSDCDDTASSVHAEADETCDGVDQDCDAVVDEGLLEPIGTPRSVSGVRDVRANVALAPLGDGYVAAWQRITDVGGSDVVFARLDASLEMVGTVQRMDPDAPASAARVALLVVDRETVVAHWRARTWRARRISTDGEGPAIDVIAESDAGTPLDAAVVDGLVLFAWATSGRTSWGRTFTSALAPASASTPRALVGLHSDLEHEQRLRIVPVGGSEPSALLVYDGVFAGSTARTYADRATVRPFASEGRRVELAPGPASVIAPASTVVGGVPVVSVLLHRAGGEAEWLVIDPGHFGSPLGISWRGPSEFASSPALPQIAMVARGGSFAAIGTTPTGIRWIERARDGRLLASFPLGIPGHIVEGLALAARAPHELAVFQQSAQSGSAPGDGWLRAVGCR